jgi:hypothetical protein
MDASDLIKTLQTTLRGGGRPHMENPSAGAEIRVMLRRWIFPPTKESDWRREPRSHIARWFHERVPKRLRALLGIHIDTLVFLNSDRVPEQKIWADKKSVSILGVLFILVGWLVSTRSAYWGGVSSGLGTTLLGLSIYWLLQEG